uniref:Solute carrier family 25 member 46 n=1 Tax=Trichuris muris TaxID=70415 RepID=A0A5S6QUB4_TRIMR
MMSVYAERTDRGYNRHGSQLSDLRAANESLPVPQRALAWLSGTSTEFAPPTGCSPGELSPVTGSPRVNRVIELLKRPVAAPPSRRPRHLLSSDLAAVTRHSQSTSDSAEILIGTGVGIGCLLVENFLSLPFVVLRRQCQVNAAAIRCHRTPFTLFPVVYNLQQNQGIHCFWKGVSSSIVTRALDILFDRLLSELLGSPRTLTDTSTVAKVISHFFLKGLSYAITTPFTVASFIDTVQTNAVRGRPGIFDCITGGLNRLVCHRLSHYLMFNATRSYMYSVVSERLRKIPLREKSAFDAFFPEVFTAFTSNLLAEALLYPIGTVVYRLYLQGSRVIIDNMDNGTSVVPVNTNYEGVLDCINTIHSEEGIKGFYKGFGVLVLQYVIHLTLVHGLRRGFLYLEQGERIQLPPSSYSHHEVNVTDRNIHSWMNGRRPDIE